MKTFKDALRLFLLFFKIGLTTFGGGYAMISIIEEECVSKRKYITQPEMLEMIAIAESTPGPIAINSATYVGYKKAGILGGIFATLGVNLPSFIIIFVISLFFDEFMSLTYVRKAFKGIQCGVGVLIALAGVKMFKRLDKTPYNVVSFVVVTLFMIVVSLFAIEFSAIYVIVIGGVLGIVITGIRVVKNSKNSREKSTETQENQIENTQETAVNDDDKEGDL